MGFLDDARKKIGVAVDQHGDKISDGLDRAGQAIDKKTGGKYRDKIATGVTKAKGALDDLDAKRDDMPPASRPSESASPQGPTGPSPVPPEPGADPNEDIASGVRPFPSGGPA